MTTRACAVRVLAVGAALALLLASCRYETLARAHATVASRGPWWCTSTEEIPVTPARRWGPSTGTPAPTRGAGPGRLHRHVRRVRPGPGLRREVADRGEPPRPTAGGRSPGYVRGHGHAPRPRRHHPGDADRPGVRPPEPHPRHVGLDDVFDPVKPEVLQFGGNGRTPASSGSTTTSARPPAARRKGFPGNNDWWHHHPRSATGRRRGVRSPSTRATPAARRRAAST